MLVPGVYPSTDYVSIMAPLCALDRPLAPVSSVCRICWLVAGFTLLLCACCFYSRPCVTCLILLFAIKLCSLWRPRSRPLAPSPPVLALVVCSNLFFCGAFFRDFCPGVGHPPYSWLVVEILQ